MTLVLRLALVAAAGVASAAYLALRPKPPATVTRQLGLASLDRHLDNWLPKLPFVPYIRLGVADEDLLQITGDGTRVRVYRLRRDGEPNLCCELPADRATLVRALDSLLREDFDVRPSTPLVATVPVGA